LPPRSSSPFTYTTLFRSTLLTLTASEGVSAGIVEAVVADVGEVYQQIGNGDLEVVQHQITVVDSIIAFLINPMVSGLLILGIIGGIYFELQTPGIGFALVVAALCGVLFFAPLYLQGLADHWEIAI